MDRVDAVRRFVEVAGPYVPAEALAAARAVVGRAGERLALSREHTVVALAGATGSGKSSLFNAIAGRDLSPAGVLRPTTGVPHACVWGHGGARELLDWLGVPPAQRHEPPGDADPGLHGLVLLDLPDFDSVEEEHRVEVDRVLALVDLVVWVLDPEKYADRVVHEQYLAQFRRHRDITVVVLNKADRLAPADLERCLADLRRLLAADGLAAGVPVFGISALGDVEPLRGVLAKAVAARIAYLRRLSADVDGVSADLAPLVATDLATAEPDDRTVRGLVDALAVAAGVPVVTRATEAAYTHRARRATGWPPTRWLRRLRPDPLGRLRLGTRHDTAPAAATSIAPAGPAAGAAVGLALRTLSERAGGALPPPWPGAVLDAARSRLPDLPDALDLAVARTDLGMSRRPRWWVFIGALQWVFALAALAGLVWLGVRYALFVLALPEPFLPHVGRLPVATALLLGGLLAGLLLAVLVRPVVRWAARRRARRAAARLRAGVEAVARDLVIAPVNAVLRAYRDARAALRAAG